MTIQRYALCHFKGEQSEMEPEEWDGKPGPWMKHAAHLAAMQRERECREKLVEALEQARAWVRGDDEPTILLLRINAALAAAKELE